MLSHFSVEIMQVDLSLVNKCFYFLTFLGGGGYNNIMSYIIHF